MKIHVPAVLLSGLISSPIHAETAWVGTAIVTQAQESCGNAAQVGDFFTAIYRPAGVPLGNDADSYLALISQRSHFTMLVPNNTFRAGINYGSSYVTSQLKFGAISGAVLSWSMSPATLDLSSRNAKLVFSISNFYGVKTCNPSFRATLLLPG